MQGRAVAGSEKRTGLVGAAGGLGAYDIGSTSADEPPAVSDKDVVLEDKGSEVGVGVLSIREAKLLGVGAPAGTERA